MLRSSECDIDFENPITAIYFTGSLMGDGLESLGPANGAPAGTDISGMPLPIDCDTGGIFVGDFAPEGASVSAIHSQYQFNSISNDIVMASGNLNVQVASQTELYLYGDVTQADPLATTQINVSGEGYLLLNGNGLDVLHVTDAAVEIDHTLDNQPTIIRLYGTSQFQSPTLPVAARVEFYGTTAATPTLIVQDIACPLHLMGTGKISNAAKLAGSLNGGGALFISTTGTVETRLSSPSPDFTGDVRIRGRVLVQHSEAFGTSAGTIDLRNQSTLALDTGVELPASKQIYLKRGATQATLESRGSNTALHGNIVAYGEGTLIISASSLLADLTINGSFNMPRRSLTKTGKGRLRLSGESNHSRGTVLQSGPFIVENGRALGTGAVVMTNGANLKFDLIGDHTIANDFMANGIGQGMTMLAQSSPTRITLTGLISAFEMSFDVKHPEGTFVLSGMTNSSGFTKSGSGVLEIAISNWMQEFFPPSLSGREGTLVLNSQLPSQSNVRATGGTVRVGRNSVLDDARISVEHGGHLVLDQDVELAPKRFDVVQGTVTLNENSTLNLQSSFARLHTALVESAVGSQINIGTTQGGYLLVGGTSRITGAGTINLSSGLTNLEFGPKDYLSTPSSYDVPSDEQIALYIDVPITGDAESKQYPFAGLEVRDGGALVLNGNSNYNGDIIVGHGILEVNGSVPNAPVSVWGSGKLTGVGTVKSVKLVGGVIDPGYFTSVVTAVANGSTVRSDSLSLTVLEDLTIDRFEHGTIHFDVELNPTQIEFFNSQLGENVVPDFFVDHLLVGGTIDPRSYLGLLISSDFTLLPERKQIIQAGEFVESFVPVNRGRPVVVVNRNENEDDTVDVLPRQEPLRLPETGGRYVLSAPRNGLGYEVFISEENPVLEQAVVRSRGTDTLVLTVRGLTNDSIHVVFEDSINRAESEVTSITGIGTGNVVIQIDFASDGATSIADNRDIVRAINNNAVARALIDAEAVGTNGDLFSRHYFQLTRGRPTRLPHIYASSFSEIEIIGSDHDDTLRIVDPTGILSKIDFDGGGGSNSLIFDEFKNGKISIAESTATSDAIDIKFVSSTNATANKPTVTVSARNTTSFDASGVTSDILNLQLTDQDDIAHITEFSADPSDARYVAQALGISAIVNLEQAELHVSGGHGNDFIQLHSSARPALKPFYLNGNDGHDTLIGHAGADSIHGHAGNDLLRGGGGDDVLFGHEGNDTLRGQAGADTVSGGAGDDLIDGGSSSADLMEEELHRQFTLLASTSNGLGNDRFEGIENARLIGSNENDLIDASASPFAVTIFGGTGDDTLIGGALNDFLTGDNGNDVLNGGVGNDILQGANGDDSLHGEAGDDSLHGEAGDDFLSGGNGNDNLNGQLGDDTLSGGFGNDRLDGGGGLIDLLIELVFQDAVLSDGQLTGIGLDMLADIEQAQLLGNDRDNEINASSFSGAVTLVGGAGNDRLRSSRSGGMLIGGDGNDVLIGQAGNDTVLGENGDDSLIGGAGDDLLLGEDGNDNLTGNIGFDTLAGGSGVNRLNGDDTEKNEDATFPLRSVTNQRVRLVNKL